MKISANLGFLYTDRSLPDAIHAADADGFDAVECHFPYEFAAADVRTALHDTGLRMLGLNTVRGNVEQGDFGLSALPDRMHEARAAIEQAVEYAEAIGADNVHVMAGKTEGGNRAEDVFRKNLAYACELAAPHGIGILIEPINHRNVPGYHLSMVEHAADVISDVAADNLRLMFDCYHVQIMQGDLIHRLEKHLPLIGHVQIAAVPDRGEPDSGEVHYASVLSALASMGYHAPVGAEYIPRGKGPAGDLTWLPKLQAL